MRPGCDSPARDARPPDAAAPRRTYAREIALVLLVKLVLIVAIKLIFFSTPVSQRELADRLDGVFQATDASKPISDSPRTDHD
ncbi:cytochrome oxidase putative small subunit CydP [uncultured Propionivibrio sp.]|uniref:cytochrome oxidase putative small subunit CydP n=1 Tax=uncultured Propionivibrio sp. TaxID=426737 RepID=UPI0029C056B7|nr:cytochrome oxidase putative small subunit CydP [uncultured Propionivibrio sp.]